MSAFAEMRASRVAARSGAAALLVLVAACAEPPLKLEIRVSELEELACGGTTCDQVTMQCNAVAGIRIVDPSDPTAPYLTLCEDILFNEDRYLCSLSRLRLDDTIPLPVDTLEVQVVIFPADDLYRDANGQPICPATVKFDSANGFPLYPVAMANPLDPNETKSARPAIGGRGFWQPGDDQVVVEVGCPDLPALNEPTCEGIMTVEVRAQVTDFDTSLSVSPSLGNQLAVAVGEPQLITLPMAQEYVLNPADTTELDRNAIQPIPTWRVDVPHTFLNFACLEVLESAAGTTATLACKSASSTTSSLDFIGTRLAKETLDAILLAAGNPSLDKGITIGIVLDDAGPSANRTITLNPGGAGTVRYLSADGTNFNAPTTTAAGIFISEDAPFGTQFETVKGSDVATGIGGIVNNKITIVQLRFVNPPVGVR